MFIVAVSSRSLFNLEDGNFIYERDGQVAFDAYMRKNENKPLRPGEAFSLVNKLLALNSPGKCDRVQVILLSSNTLDAGARVMNSVRHYGLTIESAFFTSGGDRFRIAKAANVTLFLSTNPSEVRKALACGIASATVQPTSGTQAPRAESTTLCLAFDGDSVLFDDESERVNQREGLLAFQANEQNKSKVPLGAGPYKPVLQALHEIQVSLREAAKNEQVPDEERVTLRIALVTARGVMAYARVLKTFRTWSVEVDEALFCGGLPKGPFLDALGADLFVDDNLHNIASARQFVLTGHVPYGVCGAEADPAKEEQAA